MSQGGSIFSPLLKLFPRAELEQAVRQHRGERHARGFTCWGQFVDGVLPLARTPSRKLNFRAIYIDGIEFKGQHLISALGVAADGSKTVLGLRQGASENTAVAAELLENLAGRGVDFSAPMLYVLDGAKALTKAVRQRAGKTALIQRCPMHKRRNVTAHLPQQYRESVDRKMANAYAMSRYADASTALEKLPRELLELNPSAARSLEEGREETLTVQRLGLDDLLRCTLATTNPIESAFSVVDRVRGRVKRWSAPTTAG